MAQVSYEIRSGVGVVTLNRPPVNALSVEFLEEIAGAVQVLAAEAEVRALLFTSALPGIFMAGADLNAFLDEAGQARPDETRATMERFQACFREVEQVAKPTVAAISGHALGGGCEFTLTCDFRLMSGDEKSRIGLPEVSLGLFPGAGGTQRLPRIVGLGRATDMVLRGRRLSAREAWEIGLVHQVLDPDGFAAESFAFVQDLAGQATVALGLAKRNLRNAGDVPLPEGLEQEAADFVRVVDTDDAKEGIQAFFAGRKPRFQGK